MLLFPLLLILLVVFRNKALVDLLYFRKPSEALAPPRPPPALLLTLEHVVSFLRFPRGETQACPR